MRDLCSHRERDSCGVLHGARGVMAKVLTVDLVHPVHVVVGHL